MWAREDMAWLAGLFEGEGCISVAQGKYVSLIVRMTDLEVLERALTVAGLGQVTSVSVSRAHYKPQWTWTVHHREHVQALLAAMWPWLSDRRREKTVEAINAMRVTKYRNRVASTPYASGSASRVTHHASHDITRGLGNDRGTEPDNFPNK